MVEYYIDPNEKFNKGNSSFAQLIMDLGFARTPKQANAILVVIGVVFLIVSIFLFSKLTSGPEINTSGDQIDPLFFEEELLQ